MKIKKRESLKKCYMCQAFWDCPIKSNARYCRVTQQAINALSPACDEFVLGKIFYCKKLNKFMDLLACFFIRKTKKANCGTKTHSPINFNTVYQHCAIRCKQGQEIETLMEQHGTSFTPYIAPVKPLPGKTKIKIKIKKRIRLKRRNK